MENIMVVGIAGGTGSGKTTITKKIVKKFGNNVAVVHHDSYYKAHHDMTYEERCGLNYDHPDAFDTELLIQGLKDLKEGKQITCPVYDYTIHDRSEKTVIIHPAKVIIIEGSREAASRYIHRHFVPGEAVLCFEEELPLYEGLNATAYGREEDPRTLSAGIFAALRRLDTPEITKIYARCPTGGGVNYAVQNRLKKAAGFRSVNAEEAE